MPPPNSIGSGPHAIKLYIFFRVCIFVYQYKIYFIFLDIFRDFFVY